MKRLYILLLVIISFTIQATNLAFANSETIYDANGKSMCKSEGAQCIVGKDYGNYELVSSECICVISGCHTTDAPSGFQCVNPGTACSVPGGGKGTCGVASDGYENFCTCLANSPLPGAIAESPKAINKSRNQ